MRGSKPAVQLAVLRKFACYMWEGYRRHTQASSHVRCGKATDSKFASALRVARTSVASCEQNEPRRHFPPQRRQRLRGDRPSRGFRPVAARLPRLPLHSLVSGGVVRSHRHSPPPLATTTRHRATATRHRATATRHRYSPPLLPPLTNCCTTIAGQHMARPAASALTPYPQLRLLRLLGRHAAC